jgi:predicted acetyltransferase
MEITSVDETTLPVYLNLCQSYEGEFSSVTGKQPGPDGRFALDTELGGAVTGFLAYIGGLPAGLAAIARKGRASWEMCEFYVVPSCRGRGRGRAFAEGLFVRHPGAWEVKQLPGAESATRFWRRVIAAFTADRFEQDLYDDPYWGRVTRQRFACGLESEPEGSSQ